MGLFVAIDVQASDPVPWKAPLRRPAALKRDALNTSLSHTYTSTLHTLTEAEEVYLVAELYAEQIHPWTVDQVAALGAIEGRDAARWTMEGPTMVRPGEPANCTLKLEVAHSLASAPGEDWQEFRAGVYKLRSYKMRVTITRPSTDFDFRVYRLSTRAIRRRPVMRDTFTERFFARG